MSDSAMTTEILASIEAAVRETPTAQVRFGGNRATAVYLDGADILDFVAEVRRLREQCDLLSKLAANLAAELGHQRATNAILSSGGKP